MIVPSKFAARTARDEDVAMNSHHPLGGIARMNIRSYSQSNRQACLEILESNTPEFSSRRTVMARLHSSTTSQARILSWRLISDLGSALRTCLHTASALPDFDAPSAGCDSSREDAPWPLGSKSARGQSKSLHASIEQGFELRLELDRRGPGYNNLFVSRPLEKIHRLSNIGIFHFVL